MEEIKGYQIDGEYYRTIKKKPTQWDPLIESVLRQIEEVNYQLDYINHTPGKMKDDLQEIKQGLLDQYTRYNAGYMKETGIDWGDAYHESGLYLNDADDWELYGLKLDED